MTPAERELARRRRRLLQTERNGASEIATAHARVLKRLKRRLRELTTAIEAARERGERVTSSWLAQEHRYQRLVVDLEREALSFLRDALGVVQNGKGAAAALAVDDAPALVLSALGPAPREAQARVRATFNKLSPAQLEAIAIRARDGSPLRRLLAELAPDAIDEVRDALHHGVAVGRPVREIAAEFSRAAHVPLGRALSISRTEVIGAYRDVTHRTWSGSRVTEGWQWIAEFSPRTCPACMAKHGTKHRWDETLDSHPNCRCSMLPLTKSWAQLGFDIPDGRREIAGGAERFAAMPDAHKLAVLGRSRLDAYNAGRISLEDMVRPTQSRRWGAGIRQATLQELGV